MSLHSIMLVCGVLFSVVMACAEAASPAGIHLSLGADPITERVVQWTSETVQRVIVSRRDGVINYPHNSIDYEKAPMMQSTEKLHWIQRATLRNLSAGSTYDYKVGDSAPALHFEAWINQTKLGYHRSPMSFLFYGSIEERDGQKSDNHILLEEQVLHGQYHGVVNLGALSCNRTLLSYLASLQHVAGTVVYLTTPGPSERADQFSMYSRLFSMPNVPWPMTQFWYSFDTQFAHFVSFTTEVYYPEPDQRRIARQLEWLRNDLQIANDQRTGLEGSRPWIIAYSHRSLYCSGHYSCMEYRQRMKKLEDLFYEMGVDLVIGSQHDVYERSWPVYRGRRVDTSFWNPEGPVYVTSAAFTCRDEKISYTDINPGRPLWSAYKKLLRNQSTFAILTVYNRTHLLWQENLADKTQTLLDHFYLVQTRHGPFLAPSSGGVRATSVILGVVIVVLVTLIAGILYLRLKAYLRRREAERKMSYVNLTSSLEL